MENYITSRKNPLLQQVRKLLSSRQERQKTGLFVADGTKLLQEAVQWWHGLQTVILSEGVQAQVPEQVRPQGKASEQVQERGCCPEIPVPGRR